MSVLNTPIICGNSGEGGSGGALALGVGDCVADDAIQYLFCDFSRRLCFHLWKSADKASIAAEAMG